MAEGVAPSQEALDRTCFFIESATMLDAELDVCMQRHRAELHVLLLRIQSRELMREPCDVMNEEANGREPATLLHTKKFAEDNAVAIAEQNMLGSKIQQGNAATEKVKQETEIETSCWQGNAVLPDDAHQEERFEESFSDVDVGNPHSRKSIHTTKMLDDFDAVHAEKTRIQNLVEHHHFQTTAAAMIAANSLLLTIETEYLTRNVGSNIVLELLNQMCSTYFLFELVMRMMAYRSKFFSREAETRVWNFFDFFLVVVSIIEVMGQVMQTDQASFLSVVKTLKMIRIARLGRIVRFSKDLSLLTLMIMESTKALLWAVILLGLIVLIFAIVFTSYSSEYLKEQVDTGQADWHAQIINSNDENTKLAYKYFGSTLKAVYTLIQAMLGGAEWGTISDALMEVSMIAFSLFVVYLMFSMLAVLNIVTGVFVDKAVNMARAQKDYLIEQDREQKEQYAEQLKKVFISLDEDGDHTLSLHEIQTIFDKPQVGKYFEAIGFRPEDCVRLHRLLDDDGSGSVDLHEFVDGCLLLKGFARSIDVHSVRLQCKRIESRLHFLIESSQTNGAKVKRPSVHSAE